MVLPSVPLNADIRHNLLLAAREALQNAVTHAAAAEVRLVLKLDEEGVSIAIIDNGRGFDPSAVSSTGNGLQNMMRRLSSIGGSLEIKTHQGKGTTVLLRVPQNVLPVRVIGGNGIFGQKL
jgi:signal transduction histidine kinase